ncbi:hypothetical protein IQ06DRAFT_296191 [Phaeosphaeriaceae sp. SRC1lsM3a]|nr:hypothetical protein IQ06DRAFT_296191 [Stagonospora sp. SRC1lsM3a]
MEPGAHRRGSSTIPQHPFVLVHSLHDKRPRPRRTNLVDQGPQKQQTRAPKTIFQHII